ncbi:MAG TPA: MFS transporter [Gemmataceae bacterium]|nr:MFS transporter [Gemmataceae bacterium]
MSIRFRLFLMMVLEFFIWGAWFPLVFGYLPSLGFSSAEQAWILNAFPIAAIVGMFFSNQFADRNFAAERFLAFSHLVAGLAMLGLSQVTTFWPFFLLMLIHCLFYVPTISITNSIAFANMKDPQKEFGLVRVGGTIGWILAAWPFVFLLVDWAIVPPISQVGFVDWLGKALGSGLKGAAFQEGTVIAYLVAGGASLVLALYSLTLPHTPPRPPAEGESSLAWLEAMKLLGLPFVFILWVVTFADAAVHQCFFSWTARFLEGRVGIPGNWVTPVMSIGQIAEILTMFILGACLKALGWRLTMVIGILGHAARFAVFALAPDYPWLVVSINLLHGICYAFFFATVYIFVDEYFPKDIRSSAQGLFNLMILGIGPLVANSACPWLFDQVFTQNGVTDFQSLFLVPGGVALVAAVVLAVFFRPPEKTKARAEAEAVAMA